MKQLQAMEPLGKLLSLSFFFLNHDAWILASSFPVPHHLRRQPDFPGGSDGKTSAYNAGDLGSIPGSGRSAGEGNGNPLQYCCLENPMDRGAW